MYKLLRIYFLVGIITTALQSPENVRQWIIGLVVNPLIVICYVVENIERMLL